MTIKIRELTIKANVVRKNLAGEDPSPRIARPKAERFVSSLVRNFYDNEFKKRRER
ncbi:MAG: hypothetical protein J6U08_00165 [Paludibacteraceae bacterium]|jgi:hypothetical protein|nr:hypothetical protein [Paludibacteraceae bacterium]